MMGCTTLGDTVSAQSPIVRIVRAGEDTKLAGYSRVNQNCEEITLPILTLQQPPKHGVVCSQRGDTWLQRGYPMEGTLMHCVGKKSTGLHVVYLAPIGFTGGDQLRYTVRYSTTDHPVEFDLTVVPPLPDAPLPVPRDITNPAVAAPQRPGPIPPCSAVVS